MFKHIILIDKNSIGSTVALLPRFKLGEFFSSTEVVYIHFAIFFISFDQTHALLSFQSALLVSPFHSVNHFWLTFFLYFFNSEV